MQAPFDSDHDGKPDRIAVDIIRPAEAAAAHVKVPVIMDASPYFQCCGRGNESETKTYRADGTISKLPLFYDNYFVPRGYAVVGVDLVGTSRSTGCPDVGGRYEVLGAKAAIDWLNGRAAGYDANGAKVTAGWSTGKVGMIGKSWDGSIANGVAATGVAGLSTVVAISSISSWYDYTRFGGVLRSPGLRGLPGRLRQRPTEGCLRRRHRAGAGGQRRQHRRLQRLLGRPRLPPRRGQGSRGHVHRPRPERPERHDEPVRRLVEPAGRARRRPQDLAEPARSRRPVRLPARDLGTHPARLVRLLAAGHRQRCHEPAASHDRAGGRALGDPADLAGGGCGHRDGAAVSAGGSSARTFTDDPDLDENKAVAAPGTSVAGRAVFLSGALPGAVHIDGSPSVTLRVRVDRPTTELSVRLVDYGAQRRVDYLTATEGITTLKTQSCWGQSTAADDGCYFDTATQFVTSPVDILTRGWLDAAHHVSLQRRTPLMPGKWYPITVPIDATDAVIAAGHRLGVVVTQSDEEYTVSVADRGHGDDRPGRQQLAAPALWRQFGRDPGGAWHGQADLAAPSGSTSARVMRRSVPAGF